MNTLHELATKLQESIIKQQENAHDSVNLNTSKYNNLKLKMSTTIKFPHVIVTIGISEAIYNIKEGTKTEGGLGPDERYVRKWLGNSTVLYDLNEIYTHLNDLVSAEEDNGGPQKVEYEEGEADEVKRDAPKVDYRKKRGLMTVEELMQNPTGDQELTSDYEMEKADEGLKSAGYLESVDDIKKDLKAYFKSSFRKFR